MQTTLWRRLTTSGEIILALVLVAVGILVWETTTGSGQSGSSVNFNAPRVAPEVVALVNGEPVDGRLVDLGIANGATEDDAFRTAVDQELMLQAGKRLGLTATPEEAVEYLKEYEASWDGVSKEARASLEATLIAQNLPTKDLWRDAFMVEEFGIPAVTIQKLKRYVRDQADVGEAIPDSGLPAPNTAWADFLEQERARATIIDCRVEDCSGG